MQYPLPLLLPWSWLDINLPKSLTVFAASLFSHLFIQLSIQPSISLLSRFTVQLFHQFTVKLPLCSAGQLIYSAVLPPGHLTVPLIINSATYSAGRLSVPLLRCSAVYLFSCQFTWLLTWLFSYCTVQPPQCSAASILSCLTVQPFSRLTVQPFFIQPSVSSVSCSAASLFSCLIHSFSYLFTQLSSYLFIQLSILSVTAVTALLIYQFYSAIYLAAPAVQSLLQLSSCFIQPSVQPSVYSPV